MLTKQKMKDSVIAEKGESKMLEPRLINANDAIRIAMMNNVDPIQLRCYAAQIIRSTPTADAVFCGTVQGLRVSGHGRVLSYDAPGHSRSRSAI